MVADSTDLAATTQNGIETVSVSWGSALDGTARELLTSEADADLTESRSAVLEAQDFIQSLLGSGISSARDIKRAAREAGIAERTLTRAKAKLGIRVSKSGFCGGWEWRLPDSKEANDSSAGTKRQSLADEEYQVDHSERLATLASFGVTGTGWEAF